MGDEIGLSPICELTGLKPNAVALALQGLVRRKLAVAHRDPDAWAPTLSGRGMAKYVRASEPRTALPAGPKKKKWDWGR